MQLRPRPRRPEGNNNGADEKKGDRVARIEAQRLTDLESAARSVFKTGNAVLVDKLERFMAQMGGDDAKSAFTRATTQAQKLALIWTHPFDPPLDDIELLSWEQQRSQRAAAGGDVGPGDQKLLYQFNVAELKEHLLALGVPPRLATSLERQQISASVLGDFTEQDISDVAHGNVSYKRWLTKAIREVTESKPADRPRPAVDSKQLLVQALERNDYAEADRLLRLIKRGERPAPVVQPAVRPMEQFMRQLENDEKMQQDLERNLAEKRAHRRNDLHDRLGLDDDNKDMGGASASAHQFLEITFDTRNSALRQVSQLLSPASSSVKYDAAHQVRQSLQGMEQTYPLVKLMVPEGIKQCLDKLNLVSLKLKSAGELTIERRDAFEHIRTLVRTYDDHLQPMELGYLLMGGMRLAVKSTRAFEKLFQPSTYTEAAPDSVLAKVRMCAGRREKYLRMQAQIQSILDRAKRPVVVQQHAGSKRSREAARSSSDAGQREVPGWKPWNGRLLMASSAEMGVRPAHKLVKIMKQKIHDLRAENRCHGDECKRCCLYHPVNSRCDLFTFPAHRSSAFREVWREGRSAGVLTSPIDEWNSRPRRLPQYRSDSNGKCIGKPMVKGPDHQ